jgi:hypothetical protein
MKEIRNITTGEFTFNRQDLKSGVYFYQLRNESGHAFSGKMLVQ